MISSSEPERACAVLIGTSEYSDEGWEPLPAVRRNIASLTELLCSPRCRLPPRNVSWVVDADNSSDAEVRIRRAATDGPRAGGAWDVLLLYYAGHGVVRGSDDDLALATTRTSRDGESHALEFEKVCGILEQSQARLRIVVLDCCDGGVHLERAVRKVVPSPLGGTYAVAAGGAADIAALAPPDARHTLFSGSVIDVMRDGIPDGPPELSLDHVFGSVKTHFHETNRPWVRIVGDADAGLPFAHNAVMLRASTDLLDEEDRLDATGLLDLLRGRLSRMRLVRPDAFDDGVAGIRDDLKAVYAYLDGQQTDRGSNEEGVLNVARASTDRVLDATLTFEDMFRYWARARNDMPIDDDEAFSQAAFQRRRGQHSELVRARRPVTRALERLCAALELLP